MKYKITKTDLQINNKLHSEGSEVELSKEQTKGIEDFLIPLTKPGHSALDAESKTKNKKNSNRSKK